MADKNTDFHQNKGTLPLEDTADSGNKFININGQKVSFQKPKIMGILNITPDSFFSTSRISSLEMAIEKAGEMLKDGADFLDIGAYSSRPGAADITGEEEALRIAPVIRALSKEFPEAILSIDTFRASIADICVAEGAHIINDISAGELDPLMIETVARLKVPYVLMHMRGNPQTMKGLSQYSNVAEEVFAYLHNRLATIRTAGIQDCIVDPGFGFAKNIQQNYELLNAFELFNALDAPVLAGLSRKGMVWKTLDIEVTDALNGTTVLNTIALLKGADILRVHDVKPALEAITLLQKLGKRN